MLTERQQDFVREWASTGDIVEAYYVTHDIEGRTPHAIEQSAFKLSVKPEIKTYYKDLTRRAEEIKLFAVKVDKADITDMLQDAYKMAKKQKDPGIMARTAQVLAKFHVPTLAEESIILRNANMDKNDEDMLAKYGEVMKDLAGKLPD